LGGVATGNINAQLAEIVAGITNKRGFSPKFIAIEESIGRNTAVVAILLVNSVRNII